MAKKIPIFTIKVRILGETHSQAVQEALFALGAKWNGDRDAYVQLTEKPYIFAGNDEEDNDNKFIITHGSDEGYFARHSYTEHYLIDGELLPWEIQVPELVEAKRPDPVEAALKPRLTFLAERLRDVAQAIACWPDVKNIPHAWVLELNELHATLQA